MQKNVLSESVMFCEATSYQALFAFGQFSVLLRPLFLKSRRGYKLTVTETNVLYSTVL